MNYTNVTSLNNNTVVEEVPGEIFLWSFVTLVSLGAITCCICKIRSILILREDRKLTEWLTTRHVVIE